MENLQGGDSLEDLKVDRKIILKWKIVWCGIDLCLLGSGSAESPVNKVTHFVGTCNH